MSSLCRDSIVSWRGSPLVLLLLVPLLVLVGQLLILGLHLGRLHGPASTEHLGHLARARLLYSDGCSLIVGVPHECVHAALRSVGILLSALATAPLSGVRGHRVLRLLLDKPLLVIAGHLIELGPSLRTRLSPSPAQLLANLANSKVGELLAHLGALLAREVHESTQRALWCIGVSPGARPLESLVRVVVVLSLFALEPRLVIVCHLFKHGPGDLVERVPPPAQFFGDVRHREVGVCLLDLGATHVGEVEEAREWPLRSIGISDGPVAVGSGLTWRTAVLLHLVPVEDTRLSGLVATNIAWVSH